MTAVDATFAALRVREEDLLWDVEAMSLKQLTRSLARSPLLCANAKTSVSLDFPVGHTCTPTPICARVCYAKRAGSPTTWTKSLRKRLRNLRYVQRAPTETVVTRVYSEMFARQASARFKGVRLDYLRVNGTGDLFPELVPVLNRLLELLPTVWVVTRRLDLAEKLRPLPSLYLQLSVDASTPAGELERAHALLAANPRAYLSFLRTESDQDVGRAAIVFNEKGHQGRARLDLPYEPRSCPVDAGRLELGNVRGKGGDACSRCRKCFSPGVLALEVQP